MEHVHTTDHGRLVHVRQVVDSPRNSSQLCTHLNEDLADDRSEVLSSGDRLGKDHLRWNWIFSEEESLDVVVELTLALGSW